jgi:hypothetical protein
MVQGTIPVMRTMVFGEAMLRDRNFVEIIYIAKLIDYRLVYIVDEASREGWFVRPLSPLKTDLCPADKFDSYNLVGQ